MFTIHHLNDSRSDRIIWLAEELGVPYELKTYLRDPDLPRAPASYAEIHPLGKAPVITDDNGAIMESAAIVDYIIQRYGEGRFAPTINDANYLQYIQWHHYAEGSFMFGLILSMFMTGEVFEGLEPHALAEVFSEEFKKPLAFIDDHLAANTWFAGDEFTAADIMMGWSLAMAASTGRTAGFSNIERYIESIKARPAYQKMQQLISN